MKFSAPRGTKDILPDSVYLWQYVEGVFRETCQRFGYEEIRLPTFEATGLFQRGVGEATDIVQKEMYTFLDRSGRSLTLRPEGTAGVVRAYLENGLSSWPLPVKLWYDLNAFRYERVQKGRYREFWQFGCEIFGAPSFEADCDLIALLFAFFQTLGLNEISLELNSIGCPVCRPAYVAALKDYFRPHLGVLCADCNERFDRNPLRIIDCKVDGCQPIIAKSPLQQDSLCADCRTHDLKLRERLDLLGFPYRQNPRIVRGLDYYTRTVFEFVSEHVGTQGSILGGGRYDGLVEEMGGPPTAGVGFALGVERLLLELAAQEAPLPERPLRDLFVVSFPETREAAAQLVNGLRDAGLGADLDLAERSFKAQMKLAGRGRYRALLVLGEKELAGEKAQLRRLDTGDSWAVETKVEALVQIWPELWAASER